MEFSFLGFFLGWKKNTPRSNQHMKQRPPIQLFLSSQGRGQTDTLQDWRLPQREEQGVDYYPSHCTDGVPWLCKPIRAGTEQGDSVEEYVKSDPSSGRMGLNVGAIAQTWD